MSSVANLSAQLAKEVQKLSSLRHELDAVKNDPTISDEEYTELEDMVFDCEDHILWLEEQLEAESMHEGRHGWN